MGFKFFLHVLTFDRDVTLGANAWWTVRLSEYALSTLCSEVEYSNVILLLRTGTVVLALMPSLTGKEDDADVND
jgi:hypothetical protein